MKLKNRKTGEIGTLIVDGAYNFVTNFAVEDDERNRLGEYNSLAELCEKWEDYEEPKEYWYIGDSGEVWGFSHYYLGTEIEETHREIGNLFETKEEAERAVEKLKAWKRLKDKGFKVDLWDYDGGNYQERIRTGRILFRMTDDEKLEKDLDLLFGGEE